ncbi:MAG: SSU ribosomal protein S12p (S23e), partial [uncultured Sphingomonadaceae bacterium]
ADDQPAGAPRPRAAEGTLQGPRDGGQPAEARRLHPGVHDHPKEAELGAAQGGQGPPDEQPRGDQLHPRRGPQPPGALGGADPRRPRARPAGRALPRAARRARHAGREEPQAVPLEVRRQASEV